MMDRPELHAYCQMAQAMANFVFNQAKRQTERDEHRVARDPRFAGVLQPIYFHDYMSVFENTADNLARLGILSEIDHRPYYAFRCDVSDSSASAERNWRTGPSFEELLINFINLFGEFGTDYWGFSTSRNSPFGIDSRLSSTLDALASIGYLSKTDEGYVWTDLAASAMNKSYHYWQETTPPAAP
jgi:hypothetical protein